MGAIAAAVIGAAMIGGGTFMNANAAKKRQKFTQYIADTPGVDLDETYQDSLGAIAANRSLAEQQATAENRFNQAELDRQLAEEIPGYRQAQLQRMANAQNDLQGIISPDVSSAIQRHAASRGVDSGTVGSEFNRNLEARDFGLTSLDLQQRGAQEFQSIIGTTPLAGRVSPGQYLNIDPQTALGLRSRERSQKLDILLQKAGLKGASEIYGNALTSTGGAVLSMGMGGMNMGMPGGGGTPSGAANTTGIPDTALQSRYYGSDAYKQGGPNW
jgi:hypothetical protein